MDTGTGQMDVLLVAAKKEVVQDYVAVVKESGLVPQVLRLHGQRSVDCLGDVARFDLGRQVVEGQWRKRAGRPTRDLLGRHRQRAERAADHQREHERESDQTRVACRLRVAADGESVSAHAGVDQQEVDKRGATHHQQEDERDAGDGSFSEVAESLGQPVDGKPAGDEQGQAAVISGAVRCVIGFSSRSRCARSCERPHWTQMPVSTESRAGITFTGPGVMSQLFLGMTFPEPSMVMGTTGTPALTASANGPFLNGRISPLSLRTSALYSSVVMTAPDGRVIAKSVVGMASHGATNCRACDGLGNSSSARARPCQAVDW